MIEKIEGLVMDIVRHNDRHNVVTLYTRTRGRMSFLVPVGKSKTGRMRNAALSMMAVVEADVNIREGKELFTLRNPQPKRLWHGIYANPVKSALLFFITEFASRLFRQYPADPDVWHYMVYSLEILDEAPSGDVANFHIAFLIGLLPLVGIMPRATDWQPSDRFDMLAAEMVAPDDPEVLRRRILLSERESSGIPLLLRINFSNMRVFRFGRELRHEILHHLINYYSVHLPLGSEFKSLSVLRDIFS